MDPREACEKTKVALAAARGISGESAETLYVEGFAAFIERDWKTCDASYRRSLELDPRNSRALGTFGVINCVLGNVDEGLVLLERARQADPLAAYPYAMTGCGLVVARRVEESLPFFEQAFAFERGNTLALWSHCIATAALGKYDEAIESAERSVSASRDAAFFVGLLGWALASAGRLDDANAVLVDMRNRPADSPVAVSEACLLAALGKKDAAFDVLSRAVDEFAPWAYYVGLHCFDSLRDDPRYEDLLKRMNLPE